jgi:two-component system, cell cycle sensor histidine kinase and response regulator CckA
MTPLRRRHAPEWTLTLDGDGRIITAGAGCDALTDQPVATLHGVRLDELAGDDFRAACRAALDDARTGQVHSLEMRAPPPREHELWSVVLAPVVLNGSTVAISAFGRGLTVERRTDAEFGKLLNRLAQAEKLEVVGRIAAGVAHDFNNLLTIIMGMGSLLRSGTEGTREAVYVQEILKAGDRAAQLTRELLAFSRRDEAYVTAVDMNSLLVQLDPLLRRVVPKKIELACILGARLGPIRADQVRIEELILNLALNARDAMPSGGRLLIQSFNRELAEPLDEFPATVPPGKYTVVAVSDDGCGIAPDTLPHIFEPLTTAAAADTGVGPGLAAAYAIVRQAGGYMVVYSERGAGSTFMVFLPHMTGVPEAAVEAAPKQGAAAGSETILVVDDEDSVRLFVAHTLTDAGYTVIEAENGEDALRALEDHPGTIDLILTDVMMPLVGGRELARRAASRRPDLPLIFMSGYVGDGRPSPDPRRHPFISKPFTPELLLRTVRSTLDEHARQD